MLLRLPRVPRAVAILVRRPLPLLLLLLRVVLLPLLLVLRVWLVPLLLRLLRVSVLVCKVHRAKLQLRRLLRRRRRRRRRRGLFGGIRAELQLAHVGLLAGRQCLMLVLLLRLLRRRRMLVAVQVRRKAIGLPSLQPAPGTLSGAARLASAAAGAPALPTAPAATSFAAAAVDVASAATHCVE